MKYVVTAINALTGEREAITIPMTQWKAELAMLRLKSHNSALQGKPGQRVAWRAPKVQPACEEGWIPGLIQ